MTMIGGKRIDLYVPTNSFFHKLDPRTKFALFVMSSIVALFFLDPFYLTFGIIINLVFLIGGRLPVKRIKYILLLVTIPCVTIAIFQPLWVRAGTPLFYFDWPWYHWYWITDWGLYLGYATFARGFILALSTLVLLCLARPDELARGLEKIGFPYKFGIIISLAFSFIPTFGSIAASIMEAQKARALEIEKGNIIEKIRKIAKLFPPTIYTAIGYISVVSLVMETRGFGAFNTRTSIDEYKFKLSDYIVSGFLLGYAAAGIILGILGYLATPFNLSM